MCDYIKDIKLCSCNGKEKINTENYWILHRPVKVNSDQRERLMVGEPRVNLVAFYTNPYQINEALIREKLEKRDLLDFSFFPKEGDRLFISILFPNESTPQTYDLSYNFYQWESTTGNPLSPKKAERMLKKGWTQTSFKDKK